MERYSTIGRKQFAAHTSDIQARSVRLPPTILARRKWLRSEAWTEVRRRTSKLSWSASIPGYRIADASPFTWIEIRLYDRDAEPPDADRSFAR